MTYLSPIEQLKADLVREIQKTPGEVEIYTVLAEAIVERILPLFHKALEAQKPAYHIKYGDIEAEGKEAVNFVLESLSTPQKTDPDQQRSDHHRRAYYQKERRGKSYE